MNNNVESLLMHGRDWTGEDLSGYYLTEKYDGCRAYWDGETLWSRGGLAVPMPKDWHLPAGFPLDCELYDGPGGRTRCTMAIMYQRFTETMRLIAFDAPAINGDYLHRTITASKWTWWRNYKLIVVRPSIVKSTEEAMAALSAVHRHNGEGLVMVRPNRPYTPGRGSNLLKVKKPWSE